ncbi:MAG: hypothetical protein M1840_004906 [Geoglossum simile]|nr:MAG: hypothetical protein M1840_004906 [Geoglossum simile]
MTTYAVTLAGDGCDTVVYLCKPLMESGAALSGFAICSIDLNTNWRQLSLLGAKTIIHEMTHSDAIGKAVTNLGRGTNQAYFSDEKYGREAAIGLTSQYQINNADTWAWFFLELYTEIICQGVPGWIQPT